MTTFVVRGGPLSVWFGAASGGVSVQGYHGLIFARGAIPGLFVGPRGGLMQRAAGAERGLGWGLGLGWDGMDGGLERADGRVLVGQCAMTSAGDGKGGGGGMWCGSPGGSGS